MSKLISMREYSWRKGRVSNLGLFLYNPEHEAACESCICQLHGMRKRLDRKNGKESRYWEKVFWSVTALFSRNTVQYFDCKKDKRGVESGVYTATPEVVVCICMVRRRLGVNYLCSWQPNIGAHSVMVFLHRCNRTKDFVGSVGNYTS